MMRYPDSRLLDRLGPFLLIFCVVLISMTAGCAGSPASGETEAAEAPAAEAPSGEAASERPEVVEIRSPVLLPVRIAAPIPAPELKARPISSAPEPGPRVEPAPPPAVQPPEPAVPAQEPPAKLDLPAPAQPFPAAAAKSAVIPMPDVPAPAPAVSKPKSSPAPAAPPAGTVAAAASERPAAVVSVEPEDSDTAAGEAESPAEEQEQPEEEEPEPPAPSRLAETSQGASMELPFKGSGWVYLGEVEGREGLRYNSRKFDGTSAVFRFTADREGEYTLRFQRQDPVTGEPENLLVKVTVLAPPPPEETEGGAEAAVSETAVTAGPRAAETSVPSTESIPESTEAAAVAAREEPARELPSTPEELLRFARDELSASRIASTLEALDKYMSLFPYGSDEAFYLYGKAYEQNTPYRDIKKSYGYYKRLRDEWPRSPFWKEASERVLYIERRYFEIR